MGTSTGYKMPTGGEWTPLKQVATAFVNGAGTLPPEPVVRCYVRASGKALQYATGSHSAGSSSGGSVSGANSGYAREAAQRLGGFLGRVAASGLDNALRSIGLETLIGKGSGEVAEALLDALCEPGSTLDQVAARRALSSLLSIMLQDAATYDEVGEVLAAGVDDTGLHQIIAAFFGHYVYELFVRDFYEEWALKVGHARAESSLKSIKSCIDASVRAKLVGRKLGAMDWNGPPGARLAEQTMQDVFSIFEVMQ